jgi:pheromone a factor receptor
MSSNRNLNRGRYIRLMALSAIEILGTIPIGTYFIVYNAKKPVTSWKSWSQTHDGHLYSHIFQVPASVWRNTPDESNGLEMFRWLLVACAFVFFAFFGFADEARRHYRLVYKSLISRITSTSTVTLRGSSHAYVVLCAGLDSLGSQFFQYFVCALHEEQGWRLGLCGHSEWR